MDVLQLHDIDFVQLEGVFTGFPRRTGGTLREPRIDDELPAAVPVQAAPRSRLDWISGLPDDH